MDSELRINEVIRLRHDLQGLPMGSFGRIVEIIAPDEFEAKISPSRWNTVKVRVQRTDFSLLRDETTLDEPEFWQMIAEAKAQSGGNAEREVDLLIDWLTARSLPDVYSFGEILQDVRCRAYHYGLWSVANYMRVGHKKAM
jgi:hypothetical protein